MYILFVVTGCNFDQLWIHVKTIVEEITRELPNKIPININDQYKAYLWTYLKSNKDVLFFQVSQATGKHR